MMWNIVTPFLAAVEMRRDVLENETLKSHPALLSSEEFQVILAASLYILSLFFYHGHFQSDVMELQIYLHNINCFALLTFLIMKVKLLKID